MDINLVKSYMSFLDGFFSERKLNLMSSGKSIRRKWCQAFSWGDIEVPFIRPNKSQSKHLTPYRKYYIDRLLEVILMLLPYFQGIHGGFLGN